MTQYEFMNTAGIGFCTCFWIHNVVHNTNIPKTRKEIDIFDDLDLNYVLSRQLYNYTEGRLSQLEGFSRYYISDTGHVYTMERGFLEEINGYFNFGYHIVRLTGDNGVPVKFRVHRLVCMCFIPNPYNKPLVNHMDGNKANNHYTNLEWCTDQENCLHAHRTGLAKNDKGVKDSQSIAVLYLDNEGNRTFYGSIKEAARETGSHASGIAKRAKMNQLKISSGLADINDFRNTFVYYYNVLFTFRKV